MQVERDHLLLSDVQAGLFDDCGMGILRVLVKGTSELTTCLFVPSSFISSSHLLFRHPIFCPIIPLFLSSSRLSFRHPVIVGCTLSTSFACSISLFAITI